MKLAVRATFHCLLGCSTGELLGMVPSTALDRGERRLDRALGRARVRLRLRGRGHAAMHHHA